MFKIGFKKGDKIIFRHRGGTQYREDLNLEFKNVSYKVSVKEHKKGGTIDYLNTSRIKDFLENKFLGNFLNLKEKISEVKTKYNRLQQKVSSARREINTITNHFLKDCIRHRTISDVLSKIKKSFCDFLVIKEYNNESHIYIIQKKARCDFQKYFLNEKNFRKFSLDTKALNFNPSQNSSKIMINGEKKHLRFRCVLNNGVKSLLGLSKSNVTSVLTFKL